MVPENCRASLLIENLFGWRKITFALSQGRSVVGIGSGRGLLTQKLYGICATFNQAQIIVSFNHPGKIHLIGLFILALNLTKMLNLSRN